MACCRLVIRNYSIWKSLHCPTSTDVFHAVKHGVPEIFFYLTGIASDEHTGFQAGRLNHSNKHECHVACLEIDPRTHSTYSWPISCMCSASYILQHVPQHTFGCIVGTPPSKVDILKFSLEDSQTIFKVQCLTRACTD